MSDPVIAHRCPSCGVTIREQALFCPQCGKELHQGAKDFSATIFEPAAPEKKQVSDDVTDAPSPPQAVPETFTAKARKPPLGQQALGKMGAGIQKATHAARGVEDNVVHRVQKIRNVSSVVIDEATYDPSLRFVLVAVALFVLFLVMLLLSKVIT